MRLYVGLGLNVGSCRVVWCFSHMFLCKFSARKRPETLHDPTSLHGQY